jgi:Ca2+-binding RTX toxin-like protein
VRRIAVYTVLLCALLPATAEAALVEIVQKEDSRSVSSAVHFTAAPGERNTVSFPGGGGQLIRDTGAPLEAGRGCIAVDEHTVRCDQPTNTGVAAGRFELGDADDASETPSFAAFVYGGPGDDSLRGPRLDGGPGEDLLTGTDEEDFLSGSAGNDVILGGPDEDEVSGGPGADVLDGGEGQDRLLYVDTKQPLVVDLHDPGPDGVEGELDSTSGFEHLTGGTGRDVLRGTDGANHIEGSEDDTRNGDVIDGRGGDDTLTGTEGDDRILGGSGEDRIWGVLGADRVSGGAGDDVLDLVLDGRPPPRRISCGSGRDVAWLAGPRDVIGSDCEDVVVEFHGLVALPGGGSSILFRYTRDFQRRRAPIRCGLIELGPNGRYGRLPFTAPPRGTAYLRVQLTPAGRRADRRGARISLRFTAFPDCRGPAGARGGYVIRR